MSLGKHNLEYQAVHVDLKGCVPPLKRLLQQLELYKMAHFNAVLIEWENMFPWRDSDLRAPYAYTKDEILSLGAKCRELKLEIIPLVQSLGHLETPLTLAKYAHLREIPADPGCLNPLHPEAAPLILGLLQEVLALLPEVKFFHLGGDEAASFGKSAQSQNYIRQHSAAELYLHHILPLCQFLHDKNIRPLLWGDMMVKWADAPLQKLGQVADLIPWGYQGKVSEFRPMAQRAWLKKLRQLGVTLWGGCAYKGADGYNVCCPNLTERRINTADWVETACEVGFRGLIATGWSRYSTSRPQCELVEGALESLFTTGEQFFTGGEDANLEAQVCAEIAHLPEAERIGKLTAVLTQFDELMAAHQRTLEQHIATVYSRQLRRLTGADWYIDLFLQGLQKNLAEFLDLREKFLTLVAGWLIPECAENYFEERELILRNDLIYAQTIAQKQ